MKNLVRLIVWTPVALLVLIFAIANHHIVKVSFDPFADGDIEAFAITAPLFLILFLAVMIGVLAGGAATWVTQGKYRRAARESRSEAERLRLEIKAAQASAKDARVVPSVALQHRA